MSLMETYFTRRANVTRQAAARHRSDPSSTNQTLVALDVERPTKAIADARLDRVLHGVVTSLRGDFEAAKLSSKTGTSIPSSIVAFLAVRAGPRC